MGLIYMMFWSREGGCKYSKRENEEGKGNEKKHRISYNGSVFNTQMRKRITTNMHKG